MEKFIKITLAILFFLCLAKMPYGYYQFVRFAGLIGFAIRKRACFAKGRQNRQEMTTKPTTEKEGRRHNRRLAKKRGQWLNQALCFEIANFLNPQNVMKDFKK